MFATFWKKKPALVHERLFNRLRSKEFSRLNRNGQTYLDYTGGNLYASSQLKKHQNILKNNILGNPHSINPSSILSTKLVEEARSRVLEFFNAEDDYFCVFTQNASAALHIVGECYPFGPGSQLVLLADNHNSVNGIREYCGHKGGSFTYAPIRYEDLQIDATALNTLLSASKGQANNLFAYPAQSNVSGVKHNLSWIKTAQQKGWDVLLDAAAFVPTNTLDLKKYTPDFVSVSFYKIFGYPTGIGCLLVRKSKFEKLNKPWFAGGTVSIVTVKLPHHYLHNNHERYENGTVNYLDIPAVKIGLDTVDKVGLDKINERVQSLSNYLYTNLSKLKHSNGEAGLKIFGPENREQVGGTLIMNFFDEKGNLYPFAEVEQMATTKNISIRSGCFCNPGIDEINSCLSTEELAQYFTGKDSSFNYDDMLNALGKMRGAIRVSVGWATSQKDCDTFIAFAKNLLN